MNETQAKELIQRQVGEELSARFWKLATIIGVVDLLALAGIYWTVLGTARSTAIGVAQEAAKSSDLYDDIKLRLQGQSTKASELEQKVGAFATDLGTKVDNYNKQLDSANRTIEPYVSAVKSASRTDPKRVADVIKELNELSEPGRGVLQRLKELEMDLESDVAICKAWAVIRSRGGSPEYAPTQPGQGPVPYRGNESNIKSVTRTGPGRYKVDLKTKVDTANDVIMANSVIGYTVRVGGEDNSIYIVVSNREGKEIDDIVYLLLFRPRQTP